MASQLRLAPNGAVLGFDYSVLERMEKEAAVPEEQRSKTFRDLRVMEDELVRFYQEQRSD